MQNDNFRILFYMLWSYVSLLVPFMEELVEPRRRLSRGVRKTIHFYKAIDQQHKQIKWNQINQTGFLKFKCLLI